MPRGRGTLFFPSARGGTCKVPRKFYDDLADTGHPVGIKLRDSQKGSIESLWKRANMPAGHADRGTLPARCDKEWFCNTFCKGQGKDRTGDDSIWDLIHFALLAITKGSALEIPQITDGAWNCAVPDFKGRAPGYETVGTPSISV